MDIIKQLFLEADEQAKRNKKLTTADYKGKWINPDDGEYFPPGHTINDPHIHDFENDILGDKLKKVVTLSLNKKINNLDSRINELEVIKKSENNKYPKTYLSHDMNKVPKDKHDLKTYDKLKADQSINILNSKLISLKQYRSDWIAGSLLVGSTAIAGVLYWIYRKKLKDYLFNCSKNGGGILCSVNAKMQARLDSLKIIKNKALKLNKLSNDEKLEVLNKLKPIVNKQKSKIDELKKRLSNK